MTPPAARARALFAATCLLAAIWAPSAGEVSGYLADDAPDFVALVPPPPMLGSARDQAELQIVIETAAGASRERWRTAVADDASLYDRIEGAFGRRLDRKVVPKLRPLLDRVREDMAGAIAAAKKRFARPRPFQRHQFARACGEATPRTPEINPTTGSSYPSSHAAQAWAAALILVAVAPERRDAVFARAIEYGESRIVCGYHFPSDLEAGRLLATAVVARLHASPVFRRDLACAKAEYQAASGGAGARGIGGCE
ncbi:MAG: acid phosphatase [Dongiaceae bacterium]